jgi:hypothetical protein
MKFTRHGVSACVHARALFELFVQPTADNYYGVNEFVDADLKSDSYTNDWKGPLRAFLMHAQDRSHPLPLKTADGKKELNRMPADLGREILRLWQEFEGKLGGGADEELQKLARPKRKEVIDMAACAIRSEAAPEHAKVKGQRLKPEFAFDG